MANLSQPSLHHLNVFVVKRRSTISTSSLLQVISLFAPRETLFTFCKVWIGLLITVQSDLKIFSLLLTLITVKGLHVYIYWYTPF